VLRLDRPTIEQQVNAPFEFVGAAGTQIADVFDRVEKLAAEYPDAAAYDPAPIL
jgi:adenylosuccinate lyase